MKPASLIRNVECHGGRLVVEDGDLVLYDGADVPSITKSALKRNKEAIVALLAGDLYYAPLAAKLRAYGDPFPLMVGDRIAAWLVPDDEAAQATDKAEPVYTAEEVKVVAELSPEEAQRLHELKSRLGGRISRDQLEEAQ